MPPVVIQLIRSWVSQSISMTSGAVEKVHVTVTILSSAGAQRCTQCSTRRQELSLLWAYYCRYGFQPVREFPHRRKEDG